MRMNMPRWNTNYHCGYTSLVKMDRATVGSSASIVDNCTFTPLTCHFPPPGHAISGSESCGVIDHNRRSATHLMDDSSGFIPGTSPAISDSRIIATSGWTASTLVVAPRVPTSSITVAVAKMYSDADDLQDLQRRNHQRHAHPVIEALDRYVLPFARI